MANAERGEVDIEIDGRTFTLKFTWEAITSIEDAVGKTIIETAKGMGFKETQAAITAGLLWMKKNVETAKLVRKLNPVDFVTYNQRIGMALMSVMGLVDDADAEAEAEESDEESPLSLTASTGTG